MVVRASVALGVLLVALDGGSYSIVSRQSLAIAVWWALLLGVALTLLPRHGVDRALVVTGTSLAALAALTAASFTWGTSAEIAFLELDRVVLYLGVVLLFALATRREDAATVCDGLAIGITAVAGVALASRLVPSLNGDAEVARYLPAAEERLSFPLGYWNGLGLMLALGVPLLLRAGVAADRAAVRGIAIAAIAPCAAALYLTSSRGAVAAAAIGITAFVLATDRRDRAATAVAAGAIVAAGSVGIATAFPDATDGATNGSRVLAGAALLLLSVTGGAIFGALARRPPRAPALGYGVRIAAGVTVAVLAVGATVAADPLDRARQFAAPPVAAERVMSPNGHLLSAGGAGRWQFWSAAVDEFRNHPILGGGAGSFASWWAEHGSLPLFVRDAHSLYLETLAELGLLGLALVLAAFGAGLATVARRRGPTSAAVLGCLLAYLVAAGVDWAWELPAVTVVAMVMLGVATSFGTPMRVPTSAALRTVAAVACAAVVVAQAIPLLARLHIERSQAEARRGNVAAAIAEATAAGALQPWATSPHLQLALAHEEANELGPANRAVRTALARDSRDWRLWLVSARLEAKAGAVANARRSLCRAAELNPRSSLFARHGDWNPMTSCS